MTDIVVSADSDEVRLDRFVRECLPDLPFGVVQKLIRSGQVRIDGKRAKSNTRLPMGTRVRLPPNVHPPTNKGSFNHARLRPDLIKHKTIYEDDNIIVINKPFGLPVQGGPGIDHHLDQYLTDRSRASGRRLRLVHRLDRHTTGCLVLAKSRQAAAAWAAAFRRRRVHKTYWALVKGRANPEFGCLETGLVRDPEAPHERMVVTNVDDSEADTATTHYKLVKYHSGYDVAWLELKPKTGRTHQLRVHCAHIACPIVGDPKYLLHSDWKLPGGFQNRLHLHARSISLASAMASETDIVAPLDQHMVQSFNLCGFRHA